MARNLFARKAATETLSIKGEAPIKKKRRRFTWDDFELTLLSLPTVAWFIAFCYIQIGRAHV